MSVAVQEMFRGISARYDLANDVLSFGVHRLWRKWAIEFAQLEDGTKVLDLCCGTGDFAFDLANKLGPAGDVVGLDFVHEMLMLAEKKKQNRLARSSGELRFVNGDALATPFPAESFDVVTISFGIRNVDSPLACLQEVNRLLKPGGKLVIVEFGRPTLWGFSTLYRLYSTFVMPLIGGLITGRRSAYEYLPETAQKFPDGEVFLSHMKEAGFIRTQLHPLLTGIAYIYVGTNSCGGVKELAESKYCHGQI